MLHILAIIVSAKKDQLMTVRGLSKEYGGKAALMNAPDKFPVVE